MTTKPKTTKADNGALRSAMARLLKTPVPVLRAKYQRATGKDPAGLDKDTLVKTLATTADAQPAPSQPSRAPRPSTRKRDERLPAPGGSVTRDYKGKTHTLEVLAQGFRCGGKEYTSPTAAALAITGYGAVSGPAFWGFAKPPKAEKPEAPAPAPEQPAKRKAGRPIAPRRSK